MKIKHLWFVALVAALIVTQVGTLRPAYAQDYGSNWTAFYWNNKNFEGNPTVGRTDPAVNFNWQTGSPDPAIPADNFSARWATKITFTSGSYRFRAGADDGIRVAIDGNKIIDRWSDAGAGFVVNEIDVGVGAGEHTIIVDYYESGGNAGVQFSWIPTPSGPPPTSVPAASGQTSSSSHAVPVSSSLPVSSIKAVVIVDLANIRSGPSTNSAMVAEVRRDQVLGVVANNGVNTWFLVQLKDGTRGWIFRRMIYLYNGDWTKLPVTSVSAESAPVAVDVQGVARVTTLVRSGPSLRFGDKIGMVNEGQGFKVLRLSRNRGWLYIDAEGLKGWVYLPNVKVVLGDIGRLPVGD